MTFVEIYRSFCNDLNRIEKKNIAFDNKTIKHINEIKIKLSHFEKELNEVKVIEKRKEKLAYYATEDYQKRYSELRRKTVYCLTVLGKLSKEIDSLLTVLETRP